jgi:hypothetical protein
VATLDFYVRSLLSYFIFGVMKRSGAVHSRGSGLGGVRGGVGEVRLGRDRCRIIVDPIVEIIDGCRRMVLLQLCFPSSWWCCALELLADEEPGCILSST